MELYIKQISHLEKVRVSAPEDYAELKVTYQAIEYMRIATPFSKICDVK